MRVTLLILIASAAVGCSQAKPLPQCSKEPAPASLSPIERAALSDAMARYGQRCNSDEIPCKIKVSHNENKEIIVVVAHQYPDRASGKCFQAPGDQDVAIYNQNGEFVEHAMSL